MTSENQHPPMVAASLLDRAVAFFSPQRGLSRYRAKAQVAMLESNGFIGASGLRRSMRNWRPTAASADRLIEQDGEVLRDRALDLFRNNPLAASAIRTANSYVVGTGLKLEPNIDRAFLAMSEEEAKAWRITVKREFASWAESKDCDAARNLVFYEQQEVAFIAALTAGDCFGLLPMISRPNPATHYTLAVQLIESHQVSTPTHLLMDPRVSSGLVKNDRGEKIAAYIQQRHPGSGHTAPVKWRRVPFYGAKSGRRNIIHLYKPDRPGQSRGVSYLSPVIEPLKQLGRFTEAELMAAVISGMFTVFVKTESGAGFGGIQPGPITESDQGQTTPKKDYELGYGSIVDLAADEDISTATPGRPNENFDPFFVAIVRQIGAALEQPFELLLKHFTASYSASRAALLMAWKFYRQRRVWLARNFCQPIYEEWLAEAVAIGRVRAPGFFDDPAVRAAYCRADWIGDAPGQLDPLKETLAAERQVRNDFSTRTKQTRELTGGDWQENAEIRAHEEAYRRANGLAEQDKTPATRTIIDEGKRDNKNSDQKTA